MKAKENQKENREVLVRQQQATGQETHTREEDGYDDSKEGGDSAMERMDDKAIGKSIGRAEAELQMAQAEYKKREEEAGGMEEEETRSLHAHGEANIALTRASEATKEAAIQTLTQRQKELTEVRLRRVAANKELRTLQDNIETKKEALKKVERDMLKHTQQEVNTGVHSAAQENLQPSAQQERTSYASIGTGQMGFQGDMPLSDLEDYRRSGGMRGMFRNTLLKKPFEGIQRQVAEPAEGNTADTAGKVGFTVRAGVLHAIHQRDITYANTTDGQGLIQAPIEPELYPPHSLEKLGFKMQSSEHTAINLPILNDQSGTFTGGALAEGEAVPAPTSTIGNVELRANTFHVQEVHSMESTKNLQGIENALMYNAMEKLALAKLNEFLFLGNANTGVLPNRKGSLLNLSGATIQPTGTNGGAITPQAVATLLGNIADRNADDTNLKWLTNNRVRQALTSTSWNLESGGQMVIDQENPKRPTYNLLGYPMEINPQMPRDLVKGTGSGLTALMLLDVSKIHLATFGGLTVLIDPFSSLTTRQIAIHLITFCDLATNYPALVGIINDISN